MKARSIAAYALALAFVAGSGRIALAQDRGQRGQGRPDSTNRAARRDSMPENANGANAQGGHVTSDADRAAIAADEARKAEAARQAAQGNPQGVGQNRGQDPRSNNNGQNRGQDPRSNNNGQDRSNNNGQDRSNNNGQDRNYNGQDRGQDRNYNGQDRDRGQDRNYNGQDRGYNGQDRGYNGQDRRFGQNDRGFTNRDREVTRQWYRQHRSRLGPGWRDRDRLPPYLESRLRRGQRLDPMLRQRMYWLPPDLALMYGPAPRGYRYAIIGGNIVLLDDMYEVHDVFRLDFNF